MILCCEIKKTNWNFNCLVTLSTSNKLTLGQLLKRVCTNGWTSTLKGPPEKGKTWIGQFYGAIYNFCASTIEVECIGVVGKPCKTSMRESCNLNMWSEVSNYHSSLRVVDTTIASSRHWLAPMNLLTS